MTFNKNIVGHQTIQSFLTLAAAIFLCLSPYLYAGEIIRDDFSDGSISDGTPIRWTGNSSTNTSVEPDGLHIKNSTGQATIIRTSTTNSTGWSMRAQVSRRSGDLTGLGSISSSINSWALLNGSGELQVGTGTDTIGTITSFDPDDQEVIIQLDTFDNELRAWAWLPGTLPSSTEPLVTASFPTVANASAAMWVRDFSNVDGGVAESTYRWFEYSDEHIPIPVPEPNGLSLLIFAVPACLWFRHRFKNS
jgi:hypothetical protein